MFVIAQLNDAQLKALRDFEVRRGVRVLALEDMPLDTQTLDEPALAELKEIEDKTGLTLLAVH